MSTTDDTAPAAETEFAESPSISDLLGPRDAHQGTPEHQTEGEVGDQDPAPAQAAPEAAPAAPAQPAPAAETDPAAKPEKEQPFWYRKELAKRDERQKALERENAELRARGPQPSESQGEQDDPERPLTRRELEVYHARQELVGRLERSEDRFVDKLGEETFEATREWLATRPDIEEWALKQRDPWKAAHSQFSKEKLAAEIGEDPNAWREAERARIRQELLAEQQQGDERHTPRAPAAAPQMRSPPPAPASTVRSAAPRDEGGRFAGPTPISAILKR